MGTPKKAFKKRLYRNPLQGLIKKGLSLPFSLKHAFKDAFKKGRYWAPVTNRNRRLLSNVMFDFAGPISKSNIKMFDIWNQTKV